MRLIALAAFAVSLACVAQNPAPVQSAVSSQSAAPAKPKVPVLHAPAKSTAHHSGATKPVLPAPKIRPATTATAKDAAISAASKGSHHAAVHHAAVHHPPARRSSHTAHAVKPVKPVAPVPAPVVAVAPPAAAPFSQNPMMQLHGNARALVVFAPDSANAALKQQYALLASHVGDLSDRDVVMMSIVTVHHGPDDVFAGENLPSGTFRDQLAARHKFGVKDNEFVVILVDEDENEVFRSSTPMTMEDLEAQIGGPTADHLKK